MIHRVLPENDVRALLSQCPGTRSLAGYCHRVPFSSPTLEWVEQSLAQFPRGAFARLGGCSFVTPDRPPVPVRTTEEIVKLLMHPGRRAASLVWRCLQARQPVALCLREWQDIPPASEFRVFIQQRRVVGISQYHWQRVFPEIEHRIEGIRTVAREAAETIAALAHLPSVVADIAVAELRWLLIELNPACDFSSWCLFSRDSPFDRTLRYRGGDARLKSIPLT